jgi:hypothetical protein
VSAHVRDVVASKADDAGRVVWARCTCGAEWRAGDERGDPRVAMTRWVLRHEALDALL